ncbi:MAG: pyridoxal kinase [Alphaproteobacteria bacterium]
MVSGYLGDAETGPVVLEAVRLAKAANPRALYCCDPVIGDTGPGVFVRPGIPEFLREQALPVADILTPNHFELEVLSGRSVRTLTEALAAAEDLRSLGPRLVVVTSLHRDDATPGTIEILAAGREGAWLVTTPCLPIDPPPSGSGDAFAALFLGRTLQGSDVPTALSLAVSSLYGILRWGLDIGSRELPLVAAQSLIPAPEERFFARAVAGESVAA